MANQKHLELLKQGYEVWNEWRRENFTVTPYLRGADLRQVNLRAADLVNANLSAADISGSDCSAVNLSNADLQGASLRHARLRHSKLIGTNFIGANLESANLEGADLNWTDLNTANLSNAVFHKTELKHSNLSDATLHNSVLIKTALYNANLFRARFGNTTIADCIFREAKGLESCSHYGPSFLDHRTVIKSNSLPAAFLRGCGWANWQIEALKLYDPSLNPMEIAEVTNKVFQLRQGPLQLANLFISYSHKDASFINALEKRFQAKGIRYWRDIHDASSGPLEKIVKNAITQMGTVLLVLSKHSVESDWVELEVERARKLEKEGKEHVLCPVALDNSWQSCGWPERLMNQVKKYNILDFSNWRNNQEKFDRQYERLLKGLQLFYSDPKSGTDAP